MRSSFLSILAFALLIVADSAARCEAAVRESDGARRRHQFQSTSSGQRPVPIAQRQSRFSRRFPNAHPGLKLHALELSSDERHERAFAALSKRFRVDPPAVPLIVIGDDVVVGYDEDATTGAEIEARIEACRSKACSDVAAEYVRGAHPAVTTPVRRTA